MSWLLTVSPTLWELRALAPMGAPTVSVRGTEVRRPWRERRVGPALRLVLNPACPLTPYADLSVSLDGALGVTLSEGVWEVARRYVVVGPPRPREVSRAEAFVLLGAPAVLRQLGLDDAAVALVEGQYEYATVQWLAWRDAQRA